MQTNITQVLQTKKEELLEGKISCLLSLSCFSCFLYVFFHFMKVCAGDQQVTWRNYSSLGCLLKCSCRVQEDFLKKTWWLRERIKPDTNSCLQKFFFVPFLGDSSHTLHSFFSSWNSFSFHLHSKIYSQYFSSYFELQMFFPILKHLTSKRISLFILFILTQLHSGNKTP